MNNKKIRILTSLLLPLILLLPSCNLGYGSFEPDINNLPENETIPNSQLEETNPSEDNPNQSDNNEDQKKEDIEDEKDDKSNVDTPDDSTHEDDTETIKPVITNLAFSKDVYEVFLDDSIHLELNYNVSSQTDVYFLLFSSNSNIASPNSRTGDVVGKKIGSCQITAFYDDNANGRLDYNEPKAVTTINVLDPTMTISFESDSYVVAINETKEISAKSISGKVSNPIFKWFSSDNTIATVNNGIVTGIKNGKCSVTAYYDQNNNNVFDSSDPYATTNIVVVNSAYISSTKSATFLSTDVKNNNAVLPKDYYYNFDVNIYTINVEKEIPYISFSDYSNILNYQFGLHRFSNIYTYSFTKKSEGIYDLISSLPRFKDDADGLNRSELMTFNINKNQISCGNYTRFTSSVSGYNGLIPNDMSSVVGIVQTNPSLSRYITQPTSTIFNLDRYNIHLYEINEKGYIPLHLALSLAGEFNTYYYDGEMIFDTSNTNTHLFTYINSGNDSFALNLSSTKGGVSDSSFTFTKSEEGLYKTSIKSEYSVSSGYYNGIARFNSDSTLTVIVDFVTNKDTFPTTTSNSSFYSKTFNYTENNGVIIIKEGSSIIGFIRKSNNNFNKNTFGEGMKEFNYNFLTLKLDYYYGLKNNLGVDYFDNYFRSTNGTIKDHLGYETMSSNTIYNHIMNSTTIRDYDYVLAHIINSLLGDGHTQFKNSSPYCGSCSSIDTLINKKVYSSRMYDLSMKGNTYNKQRSSSYPGLIIEGKTAIVQFDIFNGNYVYADTIKSLNDMFEKQSSNLSTSLYSEYIRNGYDTFSYIYYALYYIRTFYSNVENIVFDITVNVGGSVLLIPQLLAFMTKDPCFVIEDTQNKGLSEYHYKVDINGDGVYGSDDDTYANNYNFYILQSDFSFSCGSAFPASCKNIGCAKIIGAKYSGGGSCPISYGFDCFGSNYQISSRYNFMLKNGEKYINNDNGVLADKELNSSYWYNYSYINTWLNNNF